MNQKMYSRQLRQFRYRSKELNKLLKSGRFQQLGQEKRKELVARLRRLYQKLKPWFGTKRLRPILAGAALMLGFSHSAKAQQFADFEINPFNLQSNDSYFNFPSTADLDNDGDQDLFMVGIPESIYPGTFYYYENIGTDASPDFAPPVENPAGLVPGFAEISGDLGDLDGDGDFDLITAEGYTSSFHFFENIGTAEEPAFDSFETGPFGIGGLTYYGFVAMADIDADGDLDVFAGEYGAGIRFFENTGTATSPAFGPAQFNPFGLQSGEGLMYPEFTDIDNDGDLDLLYADYNYGGGFMGFQENTGDPANPQFEGIMQNPFGLSTYGYIAFPAAVDLDGDGDLDLIGTSNYYGVIGYFENIQEWAQADDGEVTVDENGSYFFDGSDFNFNDGGGTFLQYVQIQSLPQTGTFTFNGAPVELYQQISPDELGALIYEPVADEFGAAYDSFTFKVADDNGVYNVGEYTLTINVAEVSAVSEALALSSVNIYPNPTSGMVQVDADLDAPFGEVRLSLVNLLGQEVLVRELSARTEIREQLSLNGIPAGSYFLRLTADGKTASFSLNKQ
ncbi:MAG: T9SS type A sorting domain-containing protein [Bacteroidetes bacterium]|nr:T9SS type A sorting domain-containing protein [Bacteroidota bacterium]